MKDLIKIVISMMLVSFIMYLIWMQEKRFASAVIDIQYIQEMCQSAFHEYGINECDLA